MVTLSLTAMGGLQWTIRQAQLVCLCWSVGVTWSGASHWLCTFQNLGEPRPAETLAHRGGQIQIWVSPRLRYLWEKWTPPWGQSLACEGFLDLSEPLENPHHNYSFVSSLDLPLLCDQRQPCSSNKIQLYLLHPRQPPDAVTGYVWDPLISGSSEANQDIFRRA